MRDAVRRVTHCKDKAVEIDGAILKCLTEFQSLFRNHLPLMTHVGPQVPTRPTSCDQLSSTSKGESTIYISVPSSPSLVLPSLALPYSPIISIDAASIKELWSSIVVTEPATTTLTLGFFFSTCTRIFAQ